MKPIKSYFDEAIEAKASDLHLVAGEMPLIRVEGELKEVEDKPLPEKEAETAILSLLTADQKKAYQENLELDMGYEYTGVRFRVNIHQQRGCVEAAFRRVPLEVPTIQKLGLPSIISDLARRPNGLVLITGPTGMGKTTVLENMMIQDVQQGRGLAVIDPHGDFVEKILDFIPPHRINDVVYINPADVDYPVAFNVLEATNPAHRILVASGLLSVFKKMWIDSWGPRLEYILRICILSLLEYPGSTLLGIPRLLVNDEYRRKVVEKIEDPIVKSFWVEEYSQYQEKFRTEAIAPIQNKIGQFLSSSLIRNVVGQPKSSIDLREVMDNKKILLLNLAKGRIGEDNAALLGGILAFLWFNIPPARFYMSETGSMSLTLTLTVVAFMTDALGDGDGLFVLPIIALPLLVTSASVIVQMLSKKLLGRKTLLVAPLHHHFEARGWPPYKVTMRYWVLSAVMAFLGVIIALAGSL